MTLLLENKFTELATYPSGFRVSQIVIAFVIYLEIVEAHEWPFVVVIEDSCPLPGRGVDGS